MRSLARIMFALALSPLASGCGSDDYLRADGLTTGAGNAMAANTVMQMVDPWQEGVQNTKLRVPADRGAGSAGVAADDATSPQTTSN